MAKIPEPCAGLVFRYRFLRIWQYERGEQTGKERPCCILIPLKVGQLIEGSQTYDEGGADLTAKHVAGEGEVFILLIQSDPPGADQLGLELSIEDKRYVGLISSKPSYVIVSEANVDRWPNGDMCLIPGQSNAFAYAHPLAGPVMGRIARAFLQVQAAGKVRILIRHP